MYDDSVRHNTLLLSLEALIRKFTKMAAIVGPGTIVTLSGMPSMRFDVRPNESGSSAAN